ncbi:MAG TPA: lysine exporter LysO family protein [Rectinemataceae bacterium]|nr:lysine exporter LysO family protein [Rectinemataceae bacterium]
MDGLYDILILSTLLLLGAAAPRLRVGGRRILALPPKAVDLVLRLIIWALLLAMGFRLGNDRELAARIGEIGLLAFSSAFLALAGTVAAIVLSSLAMQRLSGAPGSGAPVPEAPPAAGSPGERLRLILSNLKAPATLLGFVAGGFLLGIALPRLASLDLASISAWILKALLFFIGMQFSQSGFSLKGAFFKAENLIVPAATMVGSFAGGLLLVPIFGLAGGKALALVGGFGWYSLSGVLISDLGDPVLGSASFLSNMVRESVALLCIPFLARTRFPTTAVGLGGATSMDVTLPIIYASAGPAMVPVSFVSGAILSASVPLLVPLCFLIK